MGINEWIYIVGFMVSVEIVGFIIYKVEKLVK